MMDSEKFANLTSKDGAARYEYFVRRVADFEEVWGLYHDGWATASNAEGREAIPFWPEEEFASACATATWRAYKPKKIELAVFLERWVPGMEKDGKLVAVFPLPGGAGVFVDGSELARALRDEAEQYE